MPIHLTTELESYNDYAEFFHYQVSLAQYVAIHRATVIHQYHQSHYIHNVKEQQ